MFGSEVVDVGIGVSLLFLFMSLITTALRELIENMLKTRSTDLERGIKELLNESNNSGITQKLYEHPLIASLYKGIYDTPTKDLPSYIPRQNFSLALLDIIANASVSGSPLSIEALKSSIASAGKPNATQRVVLTAIDTAEGDLDHVRKAVEDWYDGTMDRVSGWYTRRTARILGVLGFVAAVAFNVDAITVAESLIKDKSLRQAVVAQAERYNPSPGAAGAETKVTDDVLRIKDQLDKVGFPIGWAAQGSYIFPFPQACKLNRNADRLNSAYTCEWGWWVVTTFFGWIITALAIMLGAPFWFDVLNKFMVVRSTIKPKEKSPDEASTDRQSSSTPTSGVAGTSLTVDSVLNDASAFDLAAAKAFAETAVKQGSFVPHEWVNNPQEPQRGVI